jgi:hypothetical protein
MDKEDWKMKQEMKKKEGEEEETKVKFVLRVNR